MIKNLIKFWSRKPIVLVFIHLMQDLDLVLPLLTGLKNKNHLIPQVCVLDKVLNESPRVKTALQKLGIKYYKVSRLGVLTGIEPNLLGIRALITAAESTAGPHKAAHSLIKRANKLGIFTYTLQHGFENVGLNYFDQTYPADKTKLASQKVLIWGSKELLPPELAPETRSKCIAIGCPKHLNSVGTKVEISEKRDYLVVVLENLHWERYDDQYRTRFLEDLEKTALHFTNTTFLVKPHHAGVWLTSKYQGKLPQADNIIIADPRNHRWEAFTAPALIAIADGAITTPSTVALDAARIDCPVSVIANGSLDLQNYQPLPIINQSADWLAFVKQLQTSEGHLALQQKARDYVSRNIIPGDAVNRIMDLVTSDISTKNYLNMLK